MPLRAVFFDLDDTLCDTIGTRPERARKAFERLCQDYPALEAGSLVARALKGMDELRSARGVRQVLEELGLAETMAGEEALRIFVGYHDPIKPFPGVVDTVRLLGESYPLGVITNGQEWYQRGKLIHLGLDSCIQHFVASRSVGYEKPDPRIFSHALSLAGVEPSEAVFVGDRLDIDVGGAKAAGMRTVWFNHWDSNLAGDSPQPDAVIERFGELPDALARF